MRPYRYRDEESSTGSTVATVLIGAVAGFAVGMFVAQRAGGLDGLTSRLRKKLVPDGARENKHYGLASAQYDEIEDELEDPAFASSIEDDDFNGMDADESDLEASDGVPLLEERVLEAFNNDPILAERAVDIGAMGTGVIELAGWVDSDEEAEHAMTIARGVPGVETVVNRLMVDDEEQEIGETIRRREEGDPALTEARWEGQQVGIGKRRQGRSDEMDRHADPKPALEDRWLSEREAIRNAADDLDEISAERRTRSKKAKGAQAGEAEPTI